MLLFVVHLGLSAPLRRCESAKTEIRRKKSAPSLNILALLRQIDVCFSEAFAKQENGVWSQNSEKIKK